MAKTNIILIGMMGSGKTTVGKTLTKIRPGLFFMDIDEIIETKEQTPIVQIFEKQGETYFRNFETVIAEALQDDENLIIATGGGFCQRPENLNCLRKKGTVFYLKAPSNVLYERIKYDNKRPLLQTSNPRVTLSNLLAQREKNYLKADFVVDVSNKSPEKIAEEILEKL